MFTRELIQLLKRTNYDDRAEPIGSRLRDKVCTALESLGTRTHDACIVRYAMWKLPKAPL